MAGLNGALGSTFKVVRILQALSLIAIIGMAAYFVSQMVSHNNAPSNVLVGTLSVTSIAVLYCAITYILYIDNILPFLITTGMDGMLLIALVVVAVVVGKPLSYLDCQIIGSSSVSESTYQLGLELKKAFNKGGTEIKYSNWIGASKVTCYEMKAIWGLSIALCILFAFSAICSVCLWRRSKVIAPKSVEA
ncbi:MAG: hypothetical protein Q9182_006308 [Xanthomendoza sp. 2 TL-2023]